jgi:hypothetical protein
MSFYNVSAAFARGMKAGALTESRRRNLDEIHNITFGSARPK